MLSYPLPAGSGGRTGPLGVHALFGKYDQACAGFTEEALDLSFVSIVEVDYRPAGVIVEGGGRAKAHDAGRRTPGGLACQLYYSALILFERGMDINPLIHPPPALNSAYARREQHSRRHQGRDGTLLLPVLI